MDDARCAESLCETTWKVNLAVPLSADESLSPHLGRPTIGILVVNLDSIYEAFQP